MKTASTLAADLSRRLPEVAGDLVRSGQAEAAWQLGQWDSLEDRQAERFTGCGNGCLHLFPAQELYCREELHDLREDVGPHPQSGPSRHPPAAARLRAAGFWPLWVGRSRRKEIHYVKYPPK